MGVKEIRDAFNLAAGPRFSCSRVFLNMHRADGGEFQMLTIPVIDASGGGEFEVKSDMLSASVDPVTAARDLAAKVLTDHP